MLKNAYFDAALRDSPAACDPGRIETLRERLCGGILCGPGAWQWREALALAAPASRWLHAGALSLVIGPDDARYPPHDPGILDLHLGDEALARQLDGPQHAWWPLLSSRALRAVRLNLSAGFGKFPLLRKLAIDFPRATFVINPFEFGPQSRWMPRVCLAEYPNIWLTTVGLAPGVAQCWTISECNEALHFAVGEVGAGKLLLATGERIGNDSADPFQWLNALASLDDPQRELIARENSMELFA